ncbi:hypothetical protein A5886_000099 [Enterococcus sp. 8G7_MSG3316]|uniref:HTH cro/C1-type domain-containing protein n=1 Tax=Candidatus Enterococcus testudinis TaxID=1834191 RepID=A0A242A1Z0_9ENTE|nr:Rgg/GadR/MutR family transcriptional regulator [Enterococcus sp. 8G7_MSG3316]OTN75055.1 hypothetical protein A5886_000099 [Enterococcus sp. 8G7_MSG3316]
MKSYGATIKAIRKSKGLLLKELVDEQLSLSLLSQFENEKTTISCERFHLLLDKLEVRFDEFQLLQTGQTHSIKQAEIRSYVVAMGPVSRLEELEALEAKYQKLLLYHQQHYSLELDHLLQLFRFDFLMKQDILSGLPTLAAYEKYSDCLFGARQYLLNTDTWGVYELRLFARVSVSMEAPLLWRCLQLAMKKSDQFSKLSGNQDILYETFATVFSVFCFFKKTDYAEKTLRLWRKRVSREEHIQEAVFLPFYEGWVAWLKKEDRAEACMDQTLNFLEMLGLTGKLAEYQELKQLVLNDNFPGILLNDPLLSE